MSREVCTITDIVLITSRNLDEGIAIDYGGQLSELQRRQSKSVCRNDSFHIGSAEVPLINQHYNGNVSEKMQSFIGESVDIFLQTSK